MMEVNCGCCRSSVLGCTREGVPVYRFDPAKRYEFPFSEACDDCIRRYKLCYHEPAGWLKPVRDPVPIPVTQSKG